MRVPVNRRQMLQAAGVSLGLPWLECMSPAAVAQQAPPQAPRRMVLICNTLGLHAQSLFPRQPGRDYETTPYLELLSAHRSDLTLFSGLSHPDQNGKEPHDTEMTWLSAARNPGLAGFRNSISLDQYAAAAISGATRYASLSLGSNTQESQSYTSNGVMIPADHRPSKVFEKLFLVGQPQDIRRQRQRLAEGRSILDLAATQARTLRRRASTADRHQLEDYFAAIRAAEQDLVTADAWLDRPKPQVEAVCPQDVADPAELVARTRALLNLIPLVLRTDSSRVVSVMIQDHSVVPNIPGVSAEHHVLTHHGQDPDRIAQLQKIEMELLRCLADLLTQLADSQEGDQRLLDQTSVLFGSNLGNANAHDPANLPILLAGGGYDHGRYVQFDQTHNTPLCNLFVSLLHGMGLETEAFGTSTGTVTI